jgi:hypothetical protein
MEERVLYSQHARREMSADEFGPIPDQEVYEASLACAIVEEYPDDRPYPSVLVLGRTEQNRPLHVVCAHAPDEDQLIVITVYEPDPKRWDEGFRQRRKP